MIAVCFAVAFASRARGGRRQAADTRGASGANKEATKNTLAAYALAAKYGMDYIECDSRLTKDGALVVMHDADVSRTTDGQGHIPGYDAGRSKGAENKAWRARGSDWRRFWRWAKGKRRQLYLDTKLFEPAYMEKLESSRWLRSRV